MTEHASFWISSGTTCVNEAAAFSRFLFIDLLFNDIILNLFTEGQEILPDVETLILKFIWQLIKSINNDSLNIRKSVKVNLILFQLLNTVNHNNFSLRVISLVEASLGIVSWVNTTCDAVITNTALECDNPFRCIVSHYIYALSFLNAHNMHGLGKSIDVS